MNDLDPVTQKGYSNLVTGFTKLFSGIVFSTVWREEMHVKVVWVTMLALANRDGHVLASLPGLADAARVSIDQCKEALDLLAAPDEYSRTKEHEGRRIEEIDGGWCLLNYIKYRELRSKDERRIKVREAVRRHRERQPIVTDVIKCNHIAEAEAEAEAEAVTTVRKKKPKTRKKTADHPDFARFVAAYPKREGGQGWKKAGELFTQLVEAGDAEPDYLISQATAYAWAMKRSGNYGKSTVKQAQTFLGPGEWWREEYEKPKTEAPRQRIGPPAEPEPVAAILDRVTGRMRPE